jgi:phenylalanyl-tRNA synthetase beta chain
LGQRSINNLVDATNFVMLELGQPMHVFDADKIGGSLIEVKKAKNGDDLKTLDGKQLILDDSILTISNNGKALAIAGIKFIKLSCLSISSEEKPLILLTSVMYFSVRFSVGGAYLEIIPLMVLIPYFV